MEGKKFKWNEEGIINLDFGGNVACQFKKTEDGIEILKAIDGYGDFILKEIREFKG